MNTSLWSMFIVFFFVVTCSSKPPVDPGPNSKVGASPSSKSVSIEGEQLANVQETKFVTEVNFEKGQSSISKTGRAEMKRVFLTAKKSGKIDHVQLVTWADEEYPSVHKKELSKGQRKLVDDRNKSLTEALKLVDKDVEVKEISMAERPSGLTGALPSETKDVKKNLETAGIPNTDTSVKIPAKAGKSIVIFLMKD